MQNWRNSFLKCFKMDVLLSWVIFLLFRMLKSFKYYLNNYIKMAIKLYKLHAQEWDWMGKMTTPHCQYRQSLIMSDKVSIWLYENINILIYLEWGRGMLLVYAVHNFANVCLSLLVLSLNHILLKFLTPEKWNEFVWKKGLMEARSSGILYFFKSKHVTVI